MTKTDVVVKISVEKTEDIEGLTKENLANKTFVLFSKKFPARPDKHILLGRIAGMALELAGGNPENLGALIIVTKE